MHSLEDIRSALMTQLGDEARFRLVSARLTLRTGVNLSNIPAHLSRDAVTIRKVVQALGAMGLALPQG